MYFYLCQQSTVFAALICTKLMHLQQNYAQFSNTEFRPNQTKYVSTCTDTNLLTLLSTVQLVLCRILRISQCFGNVLCTLFLQNFISIEKFNIKVKVKLYMALSKLWLVYNQFARSLQLVRTIMSKAFLPKSTHICHEMCEIQVEIPWRSYVRNDRYWANFYESHRNLWKLHEESLYWISWKSDKWFSRRC